MADTLDGWSASRCAADIDPANPDEAAIVQQPFDVALTPSLAL